MGYLEGDYRKHTWGNGQGELRTGEKPIDSTLMVRFPLWTVGAQSPRGPMSYYVACTPELFPWGSERVGYLSTDSGPSSVDSCSAGIKSWYSQTALGGLSKHAWNGKNTQKQDPVLEFYQHVWYCHLSTLHAFLGVWLQRQIMWVH